jgi:amidase/6-aminohexanoate-cyclic-dimer hydrolase
LFTEYADYDAIGLAGLMENGEISYLEVLDAAIARADALNPELNAIVTRLDDQAREHAREQAGGLLGGVPFLVKDLTYLKDQRCSFGSRLWQDFVPDHDAHIVTRYRQAGLNIFGKTNTPEVGLAATTESLLLGACHNPWDLTRTPGGSSGGAAAAVASGIVPAAHATDGGGSIRIPASCCGLVGLKPTRGRTPLGPDNAEGWGSMATGHAVTRTVRDSAALLDVSHGPAQGDPYFAPHFEGSYLKQHVLEPGTLRIAVDLHPINGGKVAAEVRTGVEKVVELCQELGHQVEEVELDYDRLALAQATGTLVISNVRNNVLTRCEELGVSPSLDCLEAYTLSLVQMGERITGDVYARSIHRIHQMTRWLERFLVGYDVILSPTLKTLPVPLGHLDANSDPDVYTQRFNEFWGFTNLYNATGHPAISLPLHWTRDDLPVGIQFAAGLGNELLLLRLAHQLETAASWHQRRPGIVAAAAT